MPRIVVLDGHTLNPGDIDWSPIAAQGELVVHDRTPADQIVARAAGAPYILTNKVPFTAETLAKLPDLKYIGVTATGYNIVDTQAARQHGIAVTNVPTYGTDSVAQHAAALLLGLARRVSVHSDAVHQGRWASNIDWCFTLTPIVELTGLTLGLVGLGRIGVAFARIAASMGMRLIGNSRTWPSNDRLDGLKIEPVELNDLFKQSDVVSLHCPLTADNRHMVSAARLQSMKPTAFLMNTSRGPLVDEAALADALRHGRIAGAALDVLEHEPPKADNPLIGAPNCIITPHIAWYAKAARKRLLNVAADNLQAFIGGHPQNIVNP